MYRKGTETETDETHAGLIKARAEVTWGSQVIRTSQRKFGTIKKMSGDPVKHSSTKLLDDMKFKFDTGWQRSIEFPFEAIKRYLDCKEMVS